MALSVALLAFFIATVSLGAIHAQTENDLAACNDEKDRILESCQTPETTTAPASTGPTEPSTQEPEPEPDVSFSISYTYFGKMKP